MGMLSDIEEHKRKKSLWEKFIILLKKYFGVKNV